MSLNQTPLSLNQTALAEALNLQRSLLQQLTQTTQEIRTLRRQQQQLLIQQAEQAGRITHIPEYLPRKARSLNSAIEPAELDKLTLHQILTFIPLNQARAMLEQLQKTLTTEPC